MGTSSGSNLPHQMLPPRQQPQTVLSLVSSDPHMSRSTSSIVRESPAESANSLETWPTSESVPLIRHVSDKVPLRDIATERVDIVSERMLRSPEGYLDELKNKLKSILEGNGVQPSDEFMSLQKFVQTRSDLTSKSLVRAHRAQLVILVAIKTGIQTFLHPNINLSQTTLIDIFLHKRCRNIACQNELPADNCPCETCADRKGFCNICMCVICSKFDFAINTCRWIGCDVCSHWTHTDCAIREGDISMGISAKGVGEMLFKCRACNHTSELLGWVKDVFHHCAPNWDNESLMKELDFVSRIFRGSEDTRGRKLFWKCEELIDKLKGGLTEATASKLILTFFQETELDSPKNLENGGTIAPQEACNRIAEVVKETLRKMEIVGEEKTRMYKKALLGLEECEREMEEKAKQVAEVKVERQKKKQQIDEVERIVRLKEAEAEMFQLRANEAKMEAERLERIVKAKKEETEEEYASNYLKQRLSEAEAEKEYLFEKIKEQESGGGEASQSVMYSKIREMLNGYNAPSPRMDTMRRHQD